MAKLQSAYEEKLTESPRTQSRLRTGRRINSARDDAAGLDVSESVIRDAELAEENAQLQAVLELMR